MTTLKFSITNLLEKKGDTISGPMSPMLFAKEMCRHLGLKYNRLARVWFADDRIFQKESTYHDILLIGTQYIDDLRIALWVDEGVGGVAVAMAHKSDREILLTPVYEKTAYERKLSRDELKELFDYVFDNSHLLDIPVTE